MSTLMHHKPIYKKSAINNKYILYSIENYLR